MTWQACALYIHDENKIYMMRIRFANIICLIALSSNNRKPELRIRYRKATTKPDRTARTANSEQQSQTALPEQQSHNRKLELWGQAAEQKM